MGETLCAILHDVASAVWARQKRAFVLAGLLSCVWLTACATVPVPSAQVPSLDVLNTAALSRFEMDGRLAIHTAHEAGQVRVHWSHDEQHDELTMSSPLGQTEGVLTRDRAGVRWVDGDGHAHVAGDMDALSVRWLGWKLPLQALGYWVAGAAQPDIPFRTVWHNDGLVLRQAGWRVHFVRWQERDGHRLPDRLDFSGEGVSGRLLVSDWRGMSW